MKEEPLEIERLIQDLKVNDEKRASDYEETPEEPKEAMNALVKIGETAVKPLLELLKDTSRYSCLYAIKVLGEIRDPRAAQPIIEAFSSEGFGEAFEEEEDYDQPKLTLQKIGLPALEPVLNYLEEGKKKDDAEGMVFSMRVLAHIKDEKAFKMLVNMLSHPNDEVQDWAIESLGEYGDKRAVEYLKKFLEDEELKDNVLDSIRKLDLQMYRELLTKDAERRLQQFKNSIASPILDLEYAYKYPKKFEGDEADKVGIFVREYKIRMAFADLLRKATDLGLQEAAISDKLEEELDEYVNKIEDGISKLPEQCGVIPEIARAIVSEYYPTSLKTEEKTYKNLRENREQFISGTTEWLRSRGFRVIVRDQWLVWAWQGEPPKLRGIVVTFGDSVTTRLWGEVWTDEEATSFLPLFWQSIENTAYKLLGLPPKGVPAPKEVVSWDKWKEILMQRVKNKETIAEIEKSLTYCYVCTRGGKNDLPPSRVARLDVLTDPSIRFVQVARCKEDPFSRHGARTCRVQLTRLTEEGSVTAKKIVLRTLDEKIEKLLTALSDLSERERGVIEWFIRQWLSDKLEPWDILVTCYSVSSYETYRGGRYCHITYAKRTILPEKVLADAEKMKQKLFSLGLVAHAWEHTTKGYRESEQMVTCPTIANKLSEVLDGYELNNYLQLCRRSMEFLEAKLRLLMNLQNEEGIRNTDTEWFARKFEISQSQVLDWLKEIHRCFPDLISGIDEDAVSITRYPAAVCRAVNKEKLMRLLETENSEQAYSQCIQNVGEWFTTGLTKPFTMCLMIENNLRSPFTLNDL